MNKEEAGVHIRKVRSAKVQEVSGAEPTTPTEQAAERYVKYFWKQKKKLALCSLPAGSSFSS